MGAGFSAPSNAHYNNEKHKFNPLYDLQRGQGAINGKGHEHGRLRINSSFAVCTHAAAHTLCCWVTPNVMAMSWGGECGELKANIARAFQEANIRLLVNIHAKGSEIPEAATAARPAFPGLSVLHTAGVCVSDFCWNATATPSPELMLDITQTILRKTCDDGAKVVVNCSDDMGTSLAVIASYLLLSGTPTPLQACQSVRVHFPDALSSAQDLNVLSTFARYLEHLRCIMTDRVPAANYDQPHRASKAILLQAHSLPQRGSKSQVDERTLKHSLTTALSLKRVVASLASVNRVKPLPPPALDLLKIPAMDEESGSEISAAGTPYQAFEKELSISSVKPPESYEEALLRQSRLLCGQTRHQYLHLHRFVWHTLSAMVAIARRRRFAGPSELSGSAGSAALSKPVQASGDSPHSTRSFAKTVLILLQSLSTDERSSKFSDAPCNATSDQQRLDQISKEPGGCDLVGPTPDRASLIASVNAEDFTMLSTATLFPLLHLLALYFESFSSPSITHLGLTLLTTTYTPIQIPLGFHILSHFNSSFLQRQQNSKNQGRISERKHSTTKADLTCRVDPTLSQGNEKSDLDEAKPDQTLGAAVRDLWQHCEGSKKVLPAIDQELLLIFATWMRHVRKAAGGEPQERHLTQITTWCARLLTGVQRDDLQPPVQAALRHLVEDDSLFLLALQAKKTRLQAAREAARLEDLHTYPQDGAQPPTMTSLPPISPAAAQALAVRRSSTYLFMPHLPSSIKLNNHSPPLSPRGENYMPSELLPGYVPDALEIRRLNTKGSIMSANEAS